MLETSNVFFNRAAEYFGAFVLAIRRVVRAAVARRFLRQPLPRALEA